MPRFTGTLDTTQAGGKFGGAPETPEAPAADMVPVYDPTGAFTGAYEPAPKTGKPTTYGEQMTELGRFARGYAKGAAAQVPGIAGDIETGLRQLYNVGARAAEATKGFVPSEKPMTIGRVSETSILPTTERVEEKLFAKPASASERLGMTAGEILGVPTVAGLTKAGARKATELLVGKTTKTAAEIAKDAEKLGFKLEPRQIRQTEPLGSPGFLGAAEKNQTLANRLASKATGVEAPEINREFVGKRLESLKENYQDIFNREIKVDRSLVDDLRGIADFESRVRPADVKPATQASSNLIGAFEQAQSEIGRPITAVKLDGNEIQRLRNELSRIARTSTVGDDRRIAGQFVDAIDANISRNNETLGKKLAETNRQYAATKTLEDMIEKGTIYQGNISLDKLGDYVAANSYGFGSGTSRHPLSDLAIMGRELGIRGIFEGVQEPAGQLSQLLSKTGRLVGAAARTQPARAAQRALSEGRGIYREGVEGLPLAAIEAAYQAEKKGQ